MLGLPISTLINKQLPKKALFDKFAISAAERRLFDSQISRLLILAEISSQTVTLAAGADVTAIYVVLVTLKTKDCDPRNIALLSKLIDQRMLFVLQYENIARLAAFRAGRLLLSDSRPVSTWQLNLKGFDVAAVWDNTIAEIGGLSIGNNKDLDDLIIEKERQKKLTKQIFALEKKAMSEKQPRKKWELVQKINRLKQQLEVDRDEKA